MGGCPPTNHENNVMDTVRGEPVEPTFDQLRANGINLFSEQRVDMLYRYCNTVKPRQLG